MRAILFAIALPALAAGVEGWGMPLEADLVPSPDHVASVRTAWVRHFGSRQVPADARVTCAASLPGGGTVMAGRYLLQPLTVGFGADGSVAWADVYVDPERSELEPSAVRVDSSGNSYLFLQARAKSDWQVWTVVIKYGQSGKRMWVCPHPGGYRTSVVDPAGNVSLVLTESLVRISPGGDFRWRKTPGFPWDAGKIDAIALDGEGNLYIAGTRTWWSNPSRAALASFDPTGSIRFEVWHTLPDDRAVGSSMIAVGPSGSVCLVAKQAGSPYYEMVSYNAAGLQEWVRQYSGSPEFFAPHPSNDFCLVTETAIQRIDTSGIVKWTCSRDGATAFGVRGEWTYTGSSAGGRVTTCAYDSAGTKVWTATSTPEGSTGDQIVALLPARTGEVTAACIRTRVDGGADYVGHTYNALGVSTAILRYSAPPASDNRASASCVDRSGVTYVAGAVASRHSSQGEGTLLIVKFSPWGDTLFVREVTNPVVKSFQMIGMTADGSGNIRVAGVNATGMVTLLRFSDTGVLEWTSSTSQPLEIAQAGMKTDANGNTIVYGRSYAKEAVTLMFGSVGNELWTKRQGGVEYNSIARADFDPDGNVYFGTTTGKQNTAVARLMKVSRDGQLLWERASDLSLFPVQGAGAQELAGISADSSGRCVVVLKNWRGSDSTTSVVTMCYSAAGQLLWHARDLDGWKTFFPMLVLRGSSAETIISGRGRIPPHGTSHVLLRYDSNGNRLSRTDIPGEFNLEHAALGTHGSVCFAGTPYSFRIGEDADIHTLAYGPTGSLAWLEKFDASHGASDRAVGIGVAADGMVVVTGQSGIPVQDGPPRETGTFFTVIGYTPTIAPGSLVDNPGFESAMRSWVCNTSGSARIDVVPSGERSPAAAQITIDHPDSSITFYQSGLPLEPQAAYRLTFSSRSTTGHDVAVSLIQHGQPNQTYGLSDRVCDLGREWSSFSIDFMTTGFSTLVSDGRIMFRFPGLSESGDVYQFDNVVLERLPESTGLRMVRHPSDIVGGVGQRMMFRLDAPDDDSWIQWRKNGEDIPRANLREYGTPPLTASDSGTTYSCLVTWPGAVLQTRSAALTVRAAPVSLVPNHRFDEGAKGWFVSPPDAATLAVETGSLEAHVAVLRADPDLQLMAMGVQLRQGVVHRLQFRASSASGHPVAVGFVKQTPPFTPYLEGLRTFDLTPTRAGYSMLFTPTGVPGIVADGRLMFWLSPYAVEGDDYFFSDVLLEEYVTGSTTAAEEEVAFQPLAFGMEQNSPNPFNPETTILFTTPERDHVRLIVYDLLGREVARLVDGYQEAGRHSVRFRADGIASGMYFYRIESGSFAETKRMILMK